MLEISLHPTTIEYAAASHEKIMEACDVDLSTPGSICVFYSLILPGNGTNYAVAKVLADSGELIRLCQQSMVDVIAAIDQQLYTMEIDGTYNCETAAVMLRIAELLKMPVFDKTSWPLGRYEFFYLISQCKDFQSQAIASLQPSLGFQMYGLIPSISTDSTVGKFIAADPPVDCSPVHLHIDEPPIPSSDIEKISYLKGLEGVGGSSSQASGIGFFGATVLGAALAVGSAAALQYWKGHFA